MKKNSFFALSLLTIALTGSVMLSSCNNSSETFSSSPKSEDTTQIIEYYLNSKVVTKLNKVGDTINATDLFSIKGYTIDEVNFEIVDPSIVSYANGVFSVLKNGQTEIIATPANEVDLFKASTNVYVSDTNLKTAIYYTKLTNKDNTSNVELNLSFKEDGTFSFTASAGSFSEKEHVYSFKDALDYSGTYVIKDTAETIYVFESITDQVLKLKTAYYGYDSEGKEKINLILPVYNDKDEVASVQVSLKLVTE